MILTRFYREVTYLIWTRFLHEVRRIISRITSERLKLYGRIRLFIGLFYTEIN